MGRLRILEHAGTLSRDRAEEDAMLLMEWLRKRRLAPPPPPRVARLRPRLEALEGREVPATWTGATTEPWRVGDFMCPENWDTGAYPEVGEDVIFDGTVSNISCVNFNTKGEVFNSLQIVNGYTGTVTLAEPVWLGTFLLQSDYAVFDVPSERGGLSVSVTSEFIWTGGVLNSTEFLADLILEPGATATIDPTSGTRVTGMNLVFENYNSWGPVNVGSIGTFLPGTVQFNNGAGVKVGSDLVAANPAVVSVESGVVFSGRGVLQVATGGETTLGAAGGLVRSELPLHVNGGTAMIEAQTAIFSGVAPNDPPTAANVVLGGGILYLRNGSTLAAPNAVFLISGLFATLDSVASQRATISSPLFQNDGARIALGRSLAAIPAETYSVLICTERVVWNGGIFETRYYANNGADKWEAGATFTIGGNAVVDLRDVAGQVQVGSSVPVLGAAGGFTGNPPGFSVALGVAGTWVLRAHPQGKAWDLLRTH